jgi:hypothetical protein
MWEFLEWRQEQGGLLRNIDWSPSKFGKPVQVADVFFVGMGSDDSCDFRFHLPKVTGKRPSHLGGARINGDPIVEHRGEQFSKQQRYGVG